MHWVVLRVMKDVPRQSYENGCKGDESGREVGFLDGRPSGESGKKELEKNMLYLL